MSLHQLSNDEIHEIARAKVPEHYCKLNQQRLYEF